MFYKETRRTTHTQSLVRSRIAYISEPIYVYASHTPDVPNISQRPSKSGHFLNTLVPAYRAKLFKTTRIYSYMESNPTYQQKIFTVVCVGYLRNCNIYKINLMIIRLRVGCEFWHSWPDSWLLCPS